MTQPTYTTDQLQSIMNNYAKGITEFRDGEQWVKFDSLRQMSIVIDRLRLELFPTQYQKPLGHTRIRVVKNFQ